MKTLLRSLLGLISFSALLLGASDMCNYKYESEVNKLVLPMGYYKDYVNGESKDNLKYHYFTLKTEELDHGYVYCVGINKNGKSQCIDNVDNIIDTGKIKFITIDQKRKTYFFFKKKSDAIDFILPISKEFVDSSNISLNLMRFFEEQIVDVCQDSGELDLKVALKPFEIGYKVSQSILEDNNKSGANIKASVEISNPDGIDVIVSDIYGKKSTTIKDITYTQPLTISKSGKAGFCVSYKADSDDMTLKEGEDYFCKELVFAQKDTDFQKDFWKKSLAGKKYVQIKKCALKDSNCVTPLKALGTKKAYQLVKSGYKLKKKTTQKGEYVLVGPFSDAQLTTELENIKKIVPTASAY